MNTVRLNITVPGDVGEILAEIKNKSAYIADAVREKRLAEEKVKKRKELAAAYREAATEDYETYGEWEETLGDGLDE